MFLSQVPVQVSCSPFGHWKVLEVFPGALFSPGYPITLYVTTVQKVVLHSMVTSVLSLGAAQLVGEG